MSVLEEKPITSQITYRSLPYGSIIGIFQFDHADGSFNLSLMPNKTYQLEISSPGYQSTTITLEPNAEAIGDTIAKNFYLYGVFKKGDVFKLREKIFFDQGNARLREESTAGLEEIINLLTHNPKLSIQLEGHTDSGNRKSLMTLSEQRVKAVKEYLVNMGIDPKRIKTKAYGGTRPITSENTPEARQINRRVEIRILKL